MIGADKFINDLDDASQKLHATQRYQRGYSDIDMWNFDVLFADLIVEGCNWMIKHGATSPWKLDPVEWHDILMEIRAGFISRDGNGAPNPSKETWRLLRKHFRYMWD